ncbi:DUF503 domain-containing protein [Ruminococcaceae bacterium OttesenSCG-928-L11]|nr:DUF503 domain-containing protein [Ruminococcaceae bacterium OttesenSCG-928-L11]
MIIKSMRLTMHIPWAKSLKDKRMVVKSAIAKVCDKFNVSIAEVEHQDVIQTAVLAVVCVTGDTAQADSTLEHVLCFIENRSEAQITSVEYEFH